MIGMNIHEISMKVYDNSHENPWTSSKKPMLLKELEPLKQYTFREVGPGLVDRDNYSGELPIC